MGSLNPPPPSPPLLGAVSTTSSGETVNRIKPGGLE